MAKIEIKSYRKEREREITDGLEKSMWKAGATVERQAKLNILQHAAKTPWKSTSQVASAVVHQVSISGNKIVTEIGIGQGEDAKGTTLAKIGKYLELGHKQQPGRYVAAIGKRLVKSHVPAYPWLFPAAESKRNEIKEILKGREFTID